MSKKIKILINLGLLGNEMLKYSFPLIPTMLLFIITTIFTSIVITDTDRVIGEIGS